jgi:hypothetical protein
MMPLSEPWNKKPNVKNSSITANMVEKPGEDVPALEAYRKVQGREINNQVRERGIAGDSIDKQAVYESLRRQFTESMLKHIGKPGEDTEVLQSQRISADEASKQAGAELSGPKFEEVFGRNDEQQEMTYKLCRVSTEPLAYTFYNEPVQSSGCKITRSAVTAAGLSSEVTHIKTPEIDFASTENFEEMDIDCENEIQSEPATTVVDPTDDTIQSEPVPTIADTTSDTIQSEPIPSIVDTINDTDMTQVDTTADTDMAQGETDQNNNIAEAEEEEENDWDMVSIDSCSSFIHL